MKFSKRIIIVAASLLAALALIFLILNKNVFIQRNNAPGPSGAPSATPEASPSSTPSPAPTVDKSVYMNANMDIEARIDALLSQMTLEEKAGQMVQPEQNAITLSDIKKYGFGSVLSGGGSAPSSGNKVTDWQKHINSMKKASLETRLGIPLLYGVDAVHGHNNVYGSVIFPHNISLGAAADADLVEKIGAAVAEEVRATGIQWTFAPTLGNPQNELWGRTYECFGEDSNLAALLGAAYIKGFQGVKGSSSFLNSSHVIATAKHYLGEGYTTNGINQGNVQLPAEEFEQLLRQVLLAPYKAAIEAGVRTVMPSYNSVNGLKCHGNSYLLNGVLKGELGFTGLVITDYNALEQLEGSSFKDKIIKGIICGNDLIMEPNAWKETIKAIVDGVNEGKLPIERVDDAVRRILRVKFEAGLFEEVIGSDTEKELLEGFGSDAHRELAREAVRKSLVLLKNDKLANGKTAIEYLKDSKNLLVAGPKADDLGTQCGGWTIWWQGGTGNITEGTTILEGIRAQAKKNNQIIKYSEDATINDSAEAIIVVIGEAPYAETNGDRSNTTLTVTADDKAMLQNLFENLAESQRDIPVIAVLVSGRPITIAEYVDKFDAIVMAFTPGSEGQGVADVLLGDYEFNGTLTFTWPWYASDIDKKFSDLADEVVLFKNGTGLLKNGKSIKESGTQSIGKKPEKSPAEIAAIAGGSINLSSVGNVLEAEVFNANSYLVSVGNANNITFAEGFTGEWANTKWNVYITEEGKYTLRFIIASAADSNSVALYYQTPQINDDNDANRTILPIKKTASLLDYEEFTMEVTLKKGSYEFKFMNTTPNGANFRLDKIIFDKHE